MYTAELADVYAVLTNAGLKPRMCGGNNHLVVTIGRIRAAVCLGSGNKCCPPDLVRSYKDLTRRLDNGSFNPRTSTFTCRGLGEQAGKLTFMIAPNGKREKLKKTSRGHNPRKPETQRKTKRPTRGCGR